jgi:propanediol utilization protein
MEHNNEELIKQIVKDVLDKLHAGKNEAGNDLSQSELNKNYEIGKLDKHRKKVVYCNYSNRHCHVSQEVLDALFGEGYKLSKFKDLMQPGEFAAKEVISIAGPQGTVLPVRILGPVRKSTQVEISRGDAFTLGIKNVPVRESGNTKGSPGAVLIGPEGAYNLKEGVIIAWRHIHMTPQDAEYFGVKDKDMLKIKIDSPERSLIFDRVIARVKDTYALEMHIDIDEANAAGVGQMTPVCIIKD